MQQTRRGVLQSGAALSLGALAGCLGGSGGSDGDVLEPPTLGESDTPVTIQAFEDFTCIHCRKFHMVVLPQIAAEYVEPGSAVFQRRDYPFLDPEWSWKTANAARAVQVTEGDETFYEYTDQLYEHFGDYSLDAIGSAAEAVGADPETVRSAAEEGRYRATVEADKKRGTELGVKGTPSIFVNGSMVRSYAYDEVAAAIEALLGTTGD